MGFFKRLKELKHYEDSIQEKQSTLKTLENTITEKNREFEKIQSEIDKINLEKESAITNRDLELEKTKQNQQEIIADFKERTEKARDEYNTAEQALLSVKEEVSGNNSKICLQESKLKQYKMLLTQIKKNLKNSDDIPVDVEIELNKLCPTVELHLHSFDVASLRKLINENNKIVKETLSRYEKRYTTKSNQAIYQLMVIALQAELQNILINLKFSSLDNCKENLKSMISKYLQIATDGNQTIAPTLKNFISEIEVLFNKSIEIEYEYFIQREKERQEQQALREQMRQEAEERRALEQAQKQVEKEESKYKTEISNIEQQISQIKDDDEKMQKLRQRIQELQEQLEVVNQRKEDIISRQNGKAGYVYVISNLGSFGENTFKIGMTRRLEPMDRVRELGDASVPFAFDVHSFIFSDDAVSLEQELHRRLFDKRKNKVNLRKEFFDVSIAELETLVEEINPSAEFNKTMIATEYRRSLEV